MQKGSSHISRKEMGGIMTVRVIAIKPPKEVVKKINCKNCGARLTYALSDVQHVQGSEQERGACESIDHIICPNCQKSVIVSVREVVDPMHWYK